MDNNNMPEIVNLASYSKLNEFIKARREKDTAEAEMTFEEYEVTLGVVVREIENEIKAEELARYDVKEDVIVVNGQTWNKCLENQPQTYMSASGRIIVARNLYRPAGGGKSICPMELRAGIVGGFYTPLMARHVNYMMGQMTSVETSRMFEELNIDGPSSTSCDRLPKVFGAIWEENREQWEEALRSEETVPTETSIVAVSLDGVMVPDKDAQQEAKAKREAAEKNGLSKQASGPAGYREVGCGTVTLYDSETNRLDTVRYGRAPQYKKKTLTEQLDAEVASIMATRPDLELVALADGAEENWRYFNGKIYENATRIVDFGHACEHLRTAMSSYYGEKSIEGLGEYERLKVILRDKDSGVDNVIADLESLGRKLGGKRNKTRRENFNAELKYFKNQRERMFYAEYKKRGLPIGSGIVEAACKTLATQRLKRSGMSWRDGKQAILTIRSLQQSDRWERAWKLFSEHEHREVKVFKKHGHLSELVAADNAA